MAGRLSPSCVTARGALSLQLTPRRALLDFTPG